MEKDRVNNLHSYQYNRETLKEYSDQMENLLIYNLGNEKKQDYYYYRDQNFKNLMNSHKSWLMAIAKYERTIHEINEAQSAISGAQGMEVFDLLSTNKAASFASTIMTSSANSELRDVKSTVEDLMDYLKKLKADEEVKYKNINVDDFFDLAIDLICDFSFDFSSVMSLLNLSNAEDQLNNLERSLKPLGSKIDNLVRQSEDLKNKYLSKLE